MATGPDNGAGMREIDRLHKRIDDIYIVMLIFLFVVSGLLLGLLVSRLA